MKTLISIVVFFLAVTVNVCGQNIPKDILNNAIYEEEVNGNLEEAIKLFLEIVGKNSTNRTITAEAFYHLGLANEKLGNKKAKEYYQKVINNYTDQPEFVRVAKERLSILMVAEKVSKTPLTPKFTKINIPTELSWNVALSPDGKNLALVSESKLWVMPLSGNIGPGFPGKPIQVNTEGVTVEWSGLAWSGDGKWIVFNEETTDKIRSERPEKEKFNQRIFVVPSIGGKPKQVVENYRSARVVNYRISLSPDGRNLAYSSIENNKQHVYTTQVAGGTPKQLVEIESREPVFSPDGKMIVFVEDKHLGSGEGGLGLWVIPSQGGTPQLLAEAETASSPVWSPDGTMIAFLDNSKNKQIHFVQLPKDKETTGNLTSINTPEGTEEVRLLAGWTPENKIGALMTSKKEFALYTLPSTGGQAAIISNDCYASQPRWSRDGKQVFYATIPKEGVNRFYQWFLASVSAAGGTGHPLLKDEKDKNIHFASYQGGNRISPDGKWIISSVWTPADSGGNYPRTKIWKIAVDGSKSMQITNYEGSYADMCPSWSPEGTKIAYLRTRLTGDDITFGSASMHIMNASGGDTRMLFPESDKYIFSAVWSPDGKMIAYLTADLPSGTNPTINVVNVSTGEVNVIGKLPVAHIHIELAWSPDSREIAFNGDNVIKIMNIEDGKVVDIKTNLIDADIWHLDWSPDGKQFVFAGGKGGNAEFWFLEDFLPLDKLAQNKTVGATPKVMTNKKIWNEIDTDLEGAPSPDGKYLSYVDWVTGDLAIYEIATGEKRRLTNKGSWDESNEFALMSTWSPDSKQIVYDWKNENDFCDLRIIRLDGSEPRILYSNKEVKWTYTYDWSPDGKKILAYFDRNKGSDMISQIVLISVEDGSERILKTSAITKTGQAYPENMCFSPDGRYIIYDFPQKEGSLERDIFMMSTNGNFEIPLVEHPAHDELLGYSPNGKNILFASDRNGTFSLWKKQITQEETKGNVELVKSDIGQIVPLGFTYEGSFFYGYSQKNIEMYSAELDLETGKILGPPQKIVTRFEGYNQTPAYSPDGKHLAYISKRVPLTNFPDYTIGQLGGNVLCVRSLVTGEEHEYFTELDQFIHPRWSPDGRSVIVLEREKSGSNKIDIQTGDVTLVVNDDNIGPQPTELSQDGKTAYYVQYNNKSKIYQIIVRDLESGIEKNIYQSEGSLHIRLSPDEKWLALQSYYIGGNLESKEKIPRMSILSVTGGEPKELYRFDEGIDIRAGAPFIWTLDGKYILYSMKSLKKEIEKWDLYRISATGGNPEKLGLEMGGFLTNLSVHPDGRHIAFSITEQSNAEFWVLENFLPKEETVNK